MLCWLSMALATSAHAGDVCRSDTTRLGTHATVNLRIDNDMFGGMGQDQGYSNGFLVSMVSPNLANYTDDPCLPRPARRLNRYLAWLQPDGFDEQNMIAGSGRRSAAKCSNRFSWTPARTAFSHWVNSLRSPTPGKWNSSRPRKLRATFSMK